MNTKEVREYKSNLKLTKEQREVLVGLLLGDGHLETQDNGRTYRLKVEHSISQKEYVDSLYELFQEWCPHGPTRRKRHIQFGTITSYGFYSYSSGSFRFYAQQFYQDRRRVIPSIIRKLLTPRSIAVWFMDDGSKKSKVHNTYIIHTHAFTKRELKIMCETLKKKFGIDAHIHRQYSVYRLYIMAQSARKFRGLVEPYIIPSMQYKLENTSPKSNGGV